MIDQEILDRAATLSVALQGAADELNENIRAAEIELELLNLGCRAELRLETGDVLIWAKDGKTWRLWWGAKDSDSMTILRNESREKRILGVQVLPQLVDQLLLSADAELKRVENVNAKIRAFLKTEKP